MSCNQSCADIIRILIGHIPEEAERALAAAGGRCKTAIAMLLLGCDAEEADVCLQKADGHLRQAVEKAV